MNVLPQADLEGWWATEDGVSTNTLCKDYSPHGRDMTCSSSGAAVLTADVINGEPAWYFDGTSIPLKYTGSVPVKHAFMLASCNEATFAAYRGLLTDATSLGLFVGNSGSVNFFDYSGSYTAEYRKADVVYAHAAQAAPMNNVFALLELQIPAGATMDAVQVGQQFGNTSRRHKGYFKELVIYSGIKNALERMQVYRYFAMRSRVWSRTDGGLYIFPFPADKVETRERDQEHYLSEPYTGDPVALVRGNFKRAMSLPFSLRLLQEYEAAEAFHEQHYPLTHFVYRDYRYNPIKDFEVRATSSIKEQGSSVTYRFNYSFDVIETA